MPQSQEIIHTLTELIAASETALQILGDRTEPHYLADVSVQQKVTHQLIRACEAIQTLEHHAPGWACHLSYRGRMAAFYGYLVGEPDQLKQDYVYDILRSRIPLLVLEAQELYKKVPATD